MLYLVAYATVKTADDRKFGTLQKIPPPLAEDPLCLEGYLLAILEKYVREHDPPSGVDPSTLVYNVLDPEEALLRFGPVDGS